MKLIKFLLGLIFFELFIVNITISNEYYYKKNIDRILNTYNDHKNIYRKIIEDSLIINTIIDSSFINKRSKYDGNYFKQFNYVIIPKYFLNSKAKEYVYSDNFLDYLELDTINYEFEAFLYKNNELIYYCSYCGTCFSEVFGPTNPPYFWAIDYKYLSSNDKNMDFYKKVSQVPENYFSELAFIVKGFPFDYFYISNDSIFAGDRYLQHNNENLDPNGYIKSKHPEKFIRTVANKCHPTMYFSIFQLMKYKLDHIFK